MQKFAKKWPKRLAFIKGFVMGWILLLTIAAFYHGTYKLTKQDQCMVQHLVIMRALKDHIDSGGQVPEDLSELALLEYNVRYGDGSTGSEDLSSLISYQKKKYDLRYNSDAWNKPRRIILQSSVLGSYVVAFGNGSWAVLSRCHLKPAETPSDETNMSAIHLSVGERLDALQMLMIVIYILLIVCFLTVVVVDRIMKRKYRQEMTDDA